MQYSQPMPKRQASSGPSHPKRGWLWPQTSGIFCLSCSLIYKSFLPSTPLCGSLKGDGLHCELWNSLFVSPTWSSLIIFLSWDIMLQTRLLAASLTHHQNWTLTHKPLKKKKTVDFINISKFCLLIDIKEMTSQVNGPGKHYLVKDLDPEYIKNSSTQQNQL